MLRHIGVLLLATLFLSNCGGDSGLNPFSWFQSSPDVETVENVDIDNNQDPRPLVNTVANVSVDEVPGGIIVRATGLPDVQGWYATELVAANDGLPLDGVLTFTFRGVPPEFSTRVSTQQSRELVVAKYLSDIALLGVREIRIMGVSEVSAYGSN
ncbi:MAG: hypothetical protein GKR98_08280 [Boseongicola sp.]|nr:MAG: hypothetical protein GKR98_08280 [Boseongicola sp.]